MIVERKARNKKTYLCDLDIVNLEFCIWMRLLCVADLLYGDGSEGVFAICSLTTKSAKNKNNDPV